MSTQKGRDYRASNKLAIGKLKKILKSCSFSYNIQLGCRSTHYRILHRLEFHKDSGGSYPRSQITTNSYQVHRNHTWFRMSLSMRTGRVLVFVRGRKHHMQLLCFYTLPQHLLLTLQRPKYCLNGLLVSPHGYYMFKLVQTQYIQDSCNNFSFSFFPQEKQ